MNRLMGEDDERRRLAERAPEVVERFGVEEILGKWEDLLDQVTKEGRGRSGAGEAGA